MKWVVAIVVWPGWSVYADNLYEFYPMKVMKEVTDECSGDGVWH